MARKADLNEKQSRFAHEYLVDGNATKAAIRAGYSKKTAHVTGHRLLKKAKVARLLDELRAPLLEKTKVTGARVLEEIAIIAFVRVGSRIVKVHDKLRALDLLGRHHKLFATDVRPEDVPETKQPLAPPRKIHEYTEDELLAIAAKADPKRRP